MVNNGVFYLMVSLEKRKYGNRFDQKKNNSVEYCNNGNMVFHDTQKEL